MVIKALVYPHCMAFHCITTNLMSVLLLMTSHHSFPCMVHVLGSSLPEDPQDHWSIGQSQMLP